MSLIQLRDLRRRNKRPVSVAVLIGKPPRSFEHGPDSVVIDREPFDMDLSPLVGLPVHVVDLQGDSSLTLRVIEALEGCNVKPLGVVAPAGCCGASPEHERAMRMYRETLCTTT
jgi:hypothetical protein